jgi:predicted RNA-binding protein associated with RNAse of E/G family
VNYRGNRFAPGTNIELREIWDGRTWELRSGIVVKDNPGVVAAYTPAGSRADVAVAEPGGERLRLPPRDWQLAEATVPVNRNFLAVHPEGASHSTLLIRDSTWNLLCWYINLESPLRRTTAGFEYTDHFLDVVIESDLSSWRWKDEDELSEAVDRGLVTAAHAESFYEEGERAVERLIERREPYSDAWEDWSPTESGVEKR